jgi:energy-converting hydrogenase Eha subunit E
MAGLGWVVGVGHSGSIAASITPTAGDPAMALLNTVAVMLVSLVFVVFMVLIFGDGPLSPL